MQARLRFFDGAQMNSFDAAGRKRPDMLGQLGAAQALMSMGGLVARQSSLVRRLAKYSRASVAAAVGGLLTRPENHPCAVRLEALCHLAAMACSGSERVPAANVREWLNNTLLGDELARAEDPAEDVFVSCVVSWAGTSRIFEGIWEGNDFWLQSCLSALNRPLVRPVLERTFASIRALLLLSEAVAARSGVERFAMGGGSPRGRLNVTRNGMEEGASRVSFSLGELAVLGIDCGDLDSFVFGPDQGDELRDQSMGHSVLERRPVVMVEGRTWILALPTVVGAAVRRLVLETAAELGLQDEWQAAVADDQLQRFGQASAYGWDFEMPGPMVYRRDLGAHEVMASFDVGSYAHLMLVHDDLGQVRRGGLQELRMLPPGVRRRVLEGAAELRQRPGYRRGLTVVVHGGMGRGFAMEDLQNTEDWKLLVLHLHDFVLLAGESGYSAVRARKLLARLDALHAAGFEIMELNGFANLYAYCERQAFEVAPVDAEPGCMFIAPNFLEGLRSRLRRSRDYHAVRSPCGTQWVEVERRTQEVFFDDDAMLPIYVSPAHAAHSQLAGCVETAQRTWWLSCEESSTDRERRSLIFQVWDMALNWLGKAADALDRSLPGLPDVVGIELCFPDLETPDLARPSDRLCTPPDVTVTAAGMRVDCTQAFLECFALPQNLGDRAMVEAIYEGAARYAGVSVDKADISGLVDLVVPEGARFFHRMRARSAGDEVQARSELPRPRLVQAEDEARSRFGLARLAGYTGAPGRLAPAQASRLLSNAVDALWRQIEEDLRGLDRASVVLRAMTNLEAVEKERANWGRTAAAVIALHADREATVSAANRRESARAEATTSLRAVVEMAVCASPSSGGAPCGCEDLDRLLADVSTLIEVAHANDALRYGLTDGTLVIHPSMTLDIGSILSASMRGGYLEARAERQFVDAAESYRSHFSEHLGEPDTPEPKIVLNTAFDDACRAEFGASLDGLARLLAVSANVAITAGQAVACVRESEFAILICNGLNVSLMEASRILDCLSLGPRPRWDEDRPANANPRDWYPWRYGRRLSLIRRPFVRLGTDSNTLIVVSPALLDRDIRHLAGAYLGTLPGEMFSSPEMRRWIGGAIDRVGHAFNDEVREAFANLGYEARAEVKITTLGGATALGDVDVLAWDPVGGTVYAAECKRLAPARTVGEIGERLADYTQRASAGGKRTPIQRHLDRIAFLGSNRLRLSAFTGIPLGSMTLKSCLVTHDLVPMQFSAAAAALVDIVTDVDCLGAALA